MRQIEKTFGVVLRERREAKRLTQESLAEKAGLHPTYVGLVERGKRSPTLRVARALALALGTTLADLANSAEKELREPSE